MLCLFDNKFLCNDVTFAEFKFLGYGRCVQVINRLDKEKRKTTTTTTVNPITDRIRTTNIISSTTTTTEASFNSFATSIANNINASTISTSRTILETTTRFPSANLTTTKEPITVTRSIIRLID